MMDKLVYRFSEGDGKAKQLLGGKGAALAEMTKIGLPVPPGFTITTEACNEYYRLGEVYPAQLQEQIEQALSDLENALGKRLGDEKAPLLLSVRSGAPVSMPGMMDTILNLGLNDRTVVGLADATGDKRFAFDCYRRFLQMFGNVVLGIPHERFEKLLEQQKRRHHALADTDLDADALTSLITDYKETIRASTGQEFPQDPRVQLDMAIRAVFASWNNERAIVYRRIHKIDERLGTAVNVQTMVFGNMGPDSGTGVLFTRNPSTGEKVLYGEYLKNAQGEDVVAGIRTPQPIDRLASEMPAVYEQLQTIARTLEEHYRDMQDIEFTVESGRLFMLQCRAGKRTARAAVKIAYDFVQEGILTPAEALTRIEAEQLGRLLHRNIVSDEQLTVLATGLPASPGAATGEIVLDADTAEQLGKQGKKVILVRSETTPDDIHGIVEAEGILTSRGGMTSHAAVVARGMGKPCVCGCEAVHIDEKAGEVRIGERTFHPGDIISLDGATGRVFDGEVPTAEPELSMEFQQMLEWADRERRLHVRANADTPQDAWKAREFGAQGIGLCRTEHMFMAPDRLPIVQEMILAESESERRAALDRLLPIQQSDFEGILEAMHDLPVTIRLLDPPLHEFLPDKDELLVEVARLEAAGTDEAELREKRRMLQKVQALSEANPMLGFRGCRLGLVHPEIYEMQARAIFQAVVALQKRNIRTFPEIMIPLVGDVEELAQLRRLVEETASAVEQEHGCQLTYSIGTMIEVPRAALTAGRIAEQADFFSFGTNDLTQMTFGFSRDDAEGKFLFDYMQMNILPENPFAVLDEEGVGQLIRMALEQGRTTHSTLNAGICGEHGGDPRSIAFCHRVGLDYVSCSPYRVPVARLAAAQAAVSEKHGT